MRATNSSRVRASRNWTDARRDAAVEEMHVRVDEARDDELSAGVDDFGGTGHRADLRARADGDDAVAVDRYRLRLRV